MSEPLMDPLRVHSMGVKRPLEEKRNEINELYAQHKRYYPVDKKGDLDEWGAVIKNQNEMFNRIVESKKIEKKKNMEVYGEELEKAAEKRVEEQKFNTAQEKRYELEQALRKNQESEMLKQQTYASKKSMQNILANEYENAMKLKKLRAQDERRLNLMAGQATNQKAQAELDYLNKAEKDKKQMIKQILNNDKMVHDDAKKAHNMSSVLTVDEQKKLMSEYEMKQQAKDWQFGQRYNNFNRFQNQIEKSYHQQVSSPQRDKEMKFNQIIRKQEQEAKLKAEYEAQNREAAQKNWRSSNRAFIERQIRDKQTSNKQKGESEFEADYRKRLAHEKNVNEVEFFEKFKKKQEQNNYKDMLDTQMKVSKQAKLYGNMTGVEKSLNKDDLFAWKNYDHHTYALIPGLNSSSKPVPEKILVDKQLHKRDRSFDEEQQRMNQFGLTRDVTLAKSQGPRTINMANSTRKLPDSMSLEPQRDINRIKHNVSTAQRNSSPPQNMGPQESYNHSPMTGDPSQRSLLRSGHARYQNHHLYSNYNPINGAFYQTDNMQNMSKHKNFMNIFMQ